VVAEVQAACDLAGVPHPDLVTEAGRWMVAHHSVLLFDVLGVNELRNGRSLEPVAISDEKVIRDLAEVWQGVSRKNVIEAYHDALQLKEDASTLFAHGQLDLRDRARVERLFWACCEKILKITRELPYVPEDLAGLEKGMADTYYANMSVFQSVPDHWAVKQLFPVVPLHRLDQEPTRRGVLADLTCDSDGTINQFIDQHDVKDVLELHPLNGEPYYLGIFLVGAYQEILGDLHNLFGDTTAIHVSLDQAGNYQLERVVEGDSVNEVLGYVQYSKQELVSRVRTAAEKALRAGALRIEKFALLLRRYEGSLAGYTYLAPDDVVAEVATPPAPASHGGRSNGGAVPLPANPPAQPTPSREPSTPSGSTA
jgi:arginine decarboxylase